MSIINNDVVDVSIRHFDTFITVELTQRGLTKSWVFFGQTVTIAMDFTLPSTPINQAFQAYITIQYYVLVISNEQSYA
jgi:hypothetical protein